MQIAIIKNTGEVLPVGFQDRNHDHICRWQRGKWTPSGYAVAHMEVGEPL